MIAMVTVGCVLLIVFGVWDLKFASRPVIAWRFVTNRSVLLASWIGFFDFVRISANPSRVDLICVQIPGVILPNLRLSLLLHPCRQTVVCARRKLLYRDPDGCFDSFRYPRRLDNGLPPSVQGPPRIRFVHPSPRCGANDPFKRSKREHRGDCVDADPARTRRRVRECYDAIGRSSECKACGCCDGHRRRSPLDGNWWCYREWHRYVVLPFSTYPCLHSRRAMLTYAIWYLISVSRSDMD